MADRRTGHMAIPPYCEACPPPTINQHGEVTATNATRRDADGRWLCPNHIPDAD
jgi:hypothetical protein